MKAIREKSNNEIVYVGDDLVLDSAIGLYGDGFKANNINIAEYELIEVDNVPVDYIGRHYIYTDGTWTKTQTKIDYDAEKLNEKKQTKLSQVQLKKNEMRDAGFLVNDIKFDSDIAARLAYTELGLQLQSSPEFVTMWKASNGICVTMNAALYQQVIAAGKTHIESCFAWQAAKEIEINNADNIEILESIEI